MAEWHETCESNVDQMEVFIIINNVGTKIGVDMNVKN